MEDITVIVVNWNGKRHIEKCIRGLVQQTLEDFSIILVDNGSKDGSLELISKKYPDIKTIALNRNVGFAAANNIALKNIKSEYVALLNNDAFPHPQWLEKLKDAIKENPEAGSVASKMLLYSNNELIDRAGDSYTIAGAGQLRGRGASSGNYHSREFVFGACAGAALYKTALFQDIGGFDEDFFILYEDVDLSFRSQLAGYRCIYNPEAIVYHVCSGSIGEDTHTSVYYGHRNLEWVYIKNMPDSLIKRTIVPHLIYTVAAGIYFIVRGRGGDYLRAKCHALKDIRSAMFKRSIIQGNKKVVDEYIWKLLEKERLIPRLARRLETNNSF